MIVKKRGVSEVISYAILILIAVGISILVYPYLKKLANPTPDFCDKDVSVSLSSYNCVIDLSKGVDDVTLSLNFTNKGLFNVDGVFLRMGDLSRSVLPQINNGAEDFQEEIGGVYEDNPLSPNERNQMTFFFSSSDIGLSSPTAGTYTFKLEIEPALRVDRGWALCEERIVMETISCTAS